MLQRSPSAAHQSFDRPERRLVRHLRALLDPVPQVQIGEPELPAALDLPEDVVRPVARGRRLGIEERVDG